MQEFQYASSSEVIFSTIWFRFKSLNIFHIYYKRSQLYINRNARLVRSLFNVMTSSVNHSTVHFLYFLIVTPFSLLHRMPTQCFTCKSSAKILPALSWFVVLYKSLFSEMGEPWWKPLYFLMWTYRSDNYSFSRLSYIHQFFFFSRRAGNEGALAGSMGPPGWACAQTQGASLVRWPPPPRYRFSPHTLLPPSPFSYSFKQVSTSCLNIHKRGFVDWIPADR